MQLEKLTSTENISSILENTLLYKTVLFSQHDSIALLQKSRKELDIQANTLNKAYYSNQYSNRNVVINCQNTDVRLF